MDEFEYLRRSDEKEILETWAALGCITVTSQTKVYTRGTVVRVDAAGALHDMIIYICEDYRVDGVSHFPIMWDQLAVDDVTGIHAAVQGIQLPYFGLLPARWSAGFVPDQKFIPYRNGTVSAQTAAAVGDINISDDELETILTVIGFPFATFEDVEYSKAQIVKYMIRPALQRYYTFRPIIR